MDINSICSALLSFFLSSLSLQTAIVKWNYNFSIAYGWMYDTYETKYTLFHSLHRFVCLHAYIYTSIYLTACSFFCVCVCLFIYLCVTCCEFSVAVTKWCWQSVLEPYHVMFILFFLFFSVFFFLNLYICLRRGLHCPLCFISLSFWILVSVRCVRAFSVYDL